MRPSFSSAVRFLALHGFTGEGADYSALSSSLGGSWICQDLPGHGDRVSAPPSDYSLQSLAKELIPSNSSELIGIGYSMGGRLLLHIANLYPESFRALILIGASPGLHSEEERVARRESDKEWSSILHEEGMIAFWEKWRAQPLLASLNDKIPKDRCQRNDPKGLSRSLHYHGTGALPSLWNSLAEFKMPVLVCAGEDDTKFCGIGAKMVSQIPLGNLGIIPNAGHAPHLENPDGTAEFIKKSLPLE